MRIILWLNSSWIWDENYLRIELIILELIHTVENKLPDQEKHGRLDSFLLRRIMKEGCQHSHIMPWNTMDLWFNWSVSQRVFAAEDPTKNFLCSKIPHDVQFFIHISNDIYASATSRRNHQMQSLQKMRIFVRISCIYYQALSKGVASLETFAMQSFHLSSTIFSHPETDFWHFIFRMMKHKHFTNCARWSDC
jgi:hypothetical protein